MDLDSDPGLDPDDDDDDPVIATYTVLLKPQLPAHQQLLVLQHPNRKDDLPQPSEIRLKPDSGMVELDVPLGHAVSYDKAKGVTWGKALSKSVAAKAGGTHGLAGGFGIGAPPVRMAASSKRGDPDDDIEVVGGGIGAADFNEAIRRDKVLRNQTLGGQVVVGDGQTRYMMGVFSGENVHLTPITSIAHLRPQLHHIDAKADMERSVRRTRDNDGSSSGGGSGGGASGAAAGQGGGNSAGGGGTAARGIHMTVKSAGAVENDERHVTETMADRLRVVQLEPWRRLTYVDESSDDSWALYEESFLNRGLDPDVVAAIAAASAAAAISSAAAGDVKGKGKGKEDDDGGGGGGAEGRGAEEVGKKDTAAAPAPANDESLAERVAALGTKWDEDELLHRVSARERGEVGWGGGMGAATAAVAATAAATPAEEQVKKEKEKEKKGGGGKAAASKGKNVAGDAKKGKSGRPKASGTVTAAGSSKRGGGAGASKATAMELD